MQTIPFISRLRKHSYVVVGGIIVVSLLLLSTTIFLLNQNLDPRSQAAYFTQCAPIQSNMFDRSHTAKKPELQKDTQIVRDTVAASVFSRAPEASTFRSAVERRKESLVRAMRSDPQEALKNVLNTNEQIDARLLSDNCVEQFTTVQGYLDTYVIDYTDRPSETVHAVITDTGEHVVLHTTKELSQLAGYKVDQEMLVDTNSTGNFEVIKTASQTHAFGTQNTAVILVRFKNSPVNPLTRSQIDSSIMRNVNTYYKDNSYNQTDVSWTMHGWYEIPQASTCDPDVIMNSAVNVADADINYSQYSRVLVFVTDTTPLNCPFDGIGTIGVAQRQMPDGVVTNSIAIVAMKTNTSTVPLMSLVATHELGHNLGVHHASVLDCGNQALALSGCSYDRTPQLVYGDAFNIMGNTIAHMSAPHKEYIGWLQPSQVKDVTSSGSYTVEPMASPSNGTKALKIPRGGDDYLYIEYRQPIGSDSKLGAGNNSNVFQGALLHTLISPIQTALIDVSPPLDTPITYSPALLPNQPFTDPATGVTVTINQLSTNTMTVDVVYPNTTVPPTTPTGITPSSITGTPPVTPTIPPGGVSLKIPVKLPGIGSAVGDNRTPRRSSRTGTVAITDLSGQTLEEKTTSFIFSSTDYSYTAQLVTSLPAGQYFVKVKLDNTLYKKTEQVVSLNSGVHELPVTSLAFGDLDQNNEVNMQDYSLFVSCFGNKQCNQKTSTDFNDNGVVDGIDYNILLRSFAIQQGD
ncbi:MAG TPA: zinc-dependent metalloprotease family protein [Candidatus Levybacteria bacterium]|nr:zinc-dependent metalloprotease family protein [Candidatus Levybacteria bacterium]